MSKPNRYATAARDEALIALGRDTVPTKMPIQARDRLVVRDKRSFEIENFPDIVFLDHAHTMHEVPLYQIL
jgi:hypothetical protein